MFLFCFSVLRTHQAGLALVRHNQLELGLIVSDPNVRCLFRERRECATSFEGQRVGKQKRDKPKACSESDKWGGGVKTAALLLVSLRQKEHPSGENRHKPTNPKSADPCLVQNGPCFRHGGGVFCVAFVDMFSISLM